MLNQDLVEKLSKELKIDPFTVQREYLQLLFLKYFYSQKESASVFFKGGTAIRLFLGSFRFSEDLDFTSLRSRVELKKMINKTISDLTKEGEDVVFEEEKTIANAYSGRIFQQLRDYNFPLTIRLDFSLREKPLFIENSLVETIFPIGPYPQVAHLEAKEVLAEKIRAISVRTRGRDIFDLWFLLSKNIIIDWRVVNKKMALYNKKFDLKKLIKKVESVSDFELKNDLTRFLPQSHRQVALQVKSLVLEKLKS